MWKNYLKSAWRNTICKKGYALINITGLTVGLACSFFILLWVTDEMSVDRFHESGDRLYRVWRNETNNGKVFTRGATPGLMGPAFEKDYPEIENATYVWQGLDFLVTSDDRSFREQGTYVSADFFKVFTFPLLQGDPARVLEAENSAVISAALARRLFGSDWQNDGVVGRTINVNGDGDFTITGVAQDVPDNSTIRFDLVLPIKAFFAENPWALQWGDGAAPLYVRLRQGASAADVDAKIADLIKRYSPDIRGEVVFLQPFEDVYLHGEFENGVSVGGRIDLVRIFSVVAILLLVIAGINFMNLATARSTLRSKEVGVRKAIGATQRSLATQFMVETMLLAALSFVLAMALVLGLLPLFNLVTEKNIHVQDLKPVFFGIALGIALVTGLLAGSYPAVCLSAFNPVAILRGTFRQKPGEARLRKGLVVFQFALLTVLIICTAAVYFQIRYILERDLGLNRDNLVSFELDGGGRARYESFRQELMKRSGVVNVTSSAGNPLSIRRTTSSPVWTGKDPDDETEFNLIDVGYDFVETMKMELLAGRTHARTFGTDQDGYIINEQTAGVMGMADPVGERFDLFGRPGRVVGVVKDFHMGDISAPVSPTIIRLAPANTDRVWVRTETGKTREALVGMEAVYKAFNPGYPFNYHFMDQEYEEIYRSVLVMGRLADVFAVIATFISCLGLFGLASFTTERRTKEIGIRKVLGADVAELVALLSMDFLGLVAAAFVTGAPLAHLAVHRWLAGFAYHIELGFGVFLLTGIVVLAIAMLTVSTQAIKAAMANPVQTLRSE